MKRPRARRQETRASDKCRLRLKPWCESKKPGRSSAAGVGVSGSRDRRPAATDDPRMVGGGKAPRSCWYQQSYPGRQIDPQNVELRPRYPPGLRLPRVPNTFVPRNQPDAMMKRFSLSHRGFTSAEKLEKSRWDSSRP